MKVDQSYVYKNSIKLCSKHILNIGITEKSKQKQRAYTDIDTSIQIKTIIGCSTPCHSYCKCTVTLQLRSWNSQKVLIMQLLCMYQIHLVLDQWLVKKLQYFFMIMKKSSILYSEPKRVQRHYCYHLISVYKLYKLNRKNEYYLFLSKCIENCFTVGFLWDLNERLSNYITFVCNHSNTVTFQLVFLCEKFIIMWLTFKCSNKCSGVWFML